MSLRISAPSLLLSLLLLSGCATTTPQPLVESEETDEISDERPLLGNPELPYVPEREPEVGDILHMPTGLFVDAEQMMDGVADHRLIYIGETHDNPAAHRFQLMVLKALAARYPGQLSLGMEVFVPAQQPVLDQWIAGELNEPDFLRQSNWYETWSADFAYYRDLLVFARENNIPVRGLNAEKSLVRTVGGTHPDELPDEKRQQLPDMSFVDPYQQSMVDAVFAGHGPGGKHAEGFKRVQTLWDQTMAESIVSYLKSPEGVGRKMVVVAGGHHVRFGYGIPRRVFRMMPDSYTILGTREIVIPEEKQHMVMDIEMPRFPMAPYDYVQHVKYETLPNQGVKLGVMFAPTEGGLQINQVMPDSNAEMAGMLEGDLITHLDGVEMTDMYDIKFALQNKQLGDRIMVTLLRTEQSQQLEVTFEK